MKPLARLRAFCGPQDTDLPRALNTAVGALKQSTLSGIVACIVKDKVKTRALAVDLDSPVTREIALQQLPHLKVSFLIHAERETLLKILRGELSPLQALAEGRLRYAGDVNLGVELLRQLAQTQDAIFKPCEEL